MKKYLFLSMLISLVLFACKQKTTYTSAKDYNDELIALQEKLYKAIDSLESNINADKLNIAAIDSSLENAKSVSQQVQQQIDNITPFNGEKEFYNSAKNLFSTFNDILQNEYVTLIKYLNRPLSSWSDADFKNYYDTWDKLENKIIKKENVFFKAQEKFANDNNLELQK